MYDDTTLQIIEYHLSMLIDEVRTTSFLRAILGAVKPGDVVLDMGCGTGVLSYFACIAGARRVYAVEQGPIIELAKAIQQKAAEHPEVRKFETFYIPKTRREEASPEALRDIDLLNLLARSRRQARQEAARAQTK